MTLPFNSDGILHCILIRFLTTNTRSGPHSKPHSLSRTGNGQSLCLLLLRFKRSSHFFSHSLHT
ncbi:hypothetical protein BT69DRAFT_1276972 [Atractiella rhizophila]|nr:hypothetical protein BT69DRAFT_1276972 [Atractiella rhizophila]